MPEVSHEHRVPVFDGHNDTLLRLVNTGANYYERGDEGHIDDVKAREGGLAGGFFACFVPSPGDDAPSTETKELLGSGLTGIEMSNEWGGPSLAYAQQFTNAMVAKLLELETGGISVRGLIRDDVREPAENPISVVQFAEEIRENIENDVFSAIMHFEGAEMIDENLYALEMYHAAGLRSLGPVWSRSNIFAHGVPFSESTPDTGPGLTDLGKELVQACNALGILVDLSHLNEKGFWDVAATTTAPLVATHSNAHAICQTSRNLTDKQLDAIAETGGVVGLNFNVPFLDPELSRDPDMPLSIMVDHVDHLVDKLGIEGVVFGSDFDGALMPNGVADASKLPNLIEELRGRGYDDDALRKIGYENWLRVLAETWGM